jgi:Ser/Thr protein kinase RdoA (MazF antagonist)
MTSDSVNLPTVTEDTIRAIWSAHRLGAVTQITQPLGGVRNLCFFVSDSYVVRFNTLDRGIAKFQSERIAYDLLAERALPVPRVLILDDSHTIIPYDFVVTTRLPGESLAQSWQHLSANELYTLIYAIGQCLARIHACTFRSFGKLRSLTYASWADYVYDYVERNLQAATDLHLLDQPLRTDVERSLAYAMNDLARVT